MQRHLSLVLSLVVTLTSVPVACGNDLSVPPEKIEGGSPNGMMHRYLSRHVDAAVERWKIDYEKRTTPEQITAYQRQLREAFLNAIGGLPDRTPLEPQVTGTIARPGYRVEKIIFQSQPKHYVTALLFVPNAEKFQPPYPGVVVPCGHAKPAKGHDTYQSIGALLALNGVVTLVFDPIDQGERLQFVREGPTDLWGVRAHITLGMGSILLGRNTARFEIWDGIRAIDYLQSRPEVDPQRIGITGNSGGGTQTSYLMALDERIHAAAPSCYITSLPRLLATIGPQDAEQCIFGQLAFGGDHADWIMMRAPSPVLVCAATKDFFDIGGSWDTVRYAKRLYTRMGFSANVDILENDTEHNYNKHQREGAARWLVRWLLDEDRPVIEPSITLLTEPEYTCTPDGNVMSLAEARSAYDLNEDYEKELAKRRTASWATGDRTTLFEQVRRLTGIRPMDALPKPKVESLETVAQTKYKVEKLLIHPEEGVTLPALFFLPDKTKADGVVLYLHEDGKAADAGRDGAIERLVHNGNAVLAVDLRGTGQTQAAVSKDGGYSDEYKDAMVAYMLGRSMVGMRAEDVLLCARYAAERVAGDKQQPIQLVAIGNVGVPALHAAALEPELFAITRLSRSLISWSNVIHNRINKGLAVNLVHGALTHYDLPDLVATLGEKITVSEPVNAEGLPIQ